MEFKVGQKYRIVDIDAWWDKEGYIDGNDTGEYVQFYNLDIVEVVDHESFGMIFKRADKRESQEIKSLINSNEWHDSCIELITDDIANASKMEEESDDTISLYHIADVLEDAIDNDEMLGEIIIDVDKVKLCIKSLRKAGY